MVQRQLLLVTEDIKLSSLIQGQMKSSTTELRCVMSPSETLSLIRKIEFCFFILTLFAIAYELQAMDCYSPNVMRIQLAVGLPPAHYGAQQKAFASYFTNRGVVQFKFKKPIILIHPDTGIVSSI